MFRDTFAVELLKRGVPIETVSMLLGHASIRVTEKHYKPWVKTLQDKLEADAMKGWPVITLPPGKSQKNAKAGRVHGARPGAIRRSLPTERHRTGPSRGFESPQAAPAQAA